MTSLQIQARALGDPTRAKILDRLSRAIASRQGCQAAADVSSQEDSIPRIVMLILKE